MPKISGFRDTDESVLLGVGPYGDITSRRKAPVPDVEGLGDISVLRTIPSLPLSLTWRDWG